jgi:hypothetical protein
MKPTEGCDHFRVKDRRRGHLAVDLRLDAPLVTVGDRLDPVVRAPAVPHTEPDSSMC